MTVNHPAPGVTGPGSDRADLDLFEAERPRLWGLAYRMLGVVDDAEDVVQETWLRWGSVDSADVANPAAWLTTVATRLSLDRLRSAQRSRTSYVGPWLPEPLLGGPTPDPDTDADHDPERRALLAESVTLGFLALLERLGPVDRAVLLLHDVFGWPYREVGEMIGRSESAARQIGRRARERMSGDRVRFDPDPDRVRELSEAFLEAVTAGDIESLTSMMVEDVVHIGDGGAEHHAARRPVRGRVRVARFLVNLVGRLGTGDLTGVEVHPVVANHQSGYYLTVKGEPLLLTVLTWCDDRIAAIHMIRNPSKLRAFHRAWDTSRRRSG